MTDSHVTAATKDGAASQDETNRALALSGPALFTAVAGIILVDAELLAVAGTAGYALINYMEAGPIGTGIIAAAIGLPTAWLCYQVARLAIAGERENQG